MQKADPEQIYQQLKARVEEDAAALDPLYYDLAERIVPDDKEYTPRIMAKLMNLVQAKIVAALPDPDIKPTSGKSLEISEQFARKLDMDRETVEKHIQELFEKGLLFPTKKGPAMARTFYQLHDAALGNPKFDEQMGRDYFDLWGIFDGPMRPPEPQDIHPGKSEFRVIPRWKSIENVPGVLQYENVKAILQAQDLIVLLHCGCKRSHTDRRCGIPEESCLTVGRPAQYNLDRNAGRRITYEEALEVIEKYDKLPTVHLTVNQKDVGQLICNCHYCCCMVIKGAEKSRFAAVIDPEKCRDCRACIERCQFGAVSMKHYPEFGGERACIDEEICRGCGSCVIACKAGARTMKLVRPPEHIPESLSIY